MLFSSPTLVNAVNCAVPLNINAYPAVRRTGSPPGYAPNPLYVTEMVHLIGGNYEYVSDVNMTYINVLRTHDADENYDFGDYSMSNATLPMYAKKDYLEVGDVRGPSPPPRQRAHSWTKIRVCGATAIADLPPRPKAPC